MSNSKHKLRETERELERLQENRFKSHGGRATQVHRDDSAYSRKQKHKKNWA